MKAFKKGMKVRISKDLKNSETRDKWNLDESGYMLKMQGRVFSIKSVESSFKVRIECDEAHRTFLFHSDDLEPVNIKKQKPIEFKFDTSNLDI